MRGVIAVALVAAALGAAAPASAATPTDRKIAALQKQVRALQRSVKTLKRQVREAREGVTASLVFSVCTAAVAADSFQSTWRAVDEFAGRPVFGPQPDPVREPACRALQVPRPQPVPPTVSPFASLLRFVNEPTASLRGIFG